MKRWTKAMRLTQWYDNLKALGLSFDDIETLRKAQLTLHRWHELECGVDNGGIERDEITGKVSWYNSNTGKRSPYADRETGCLKRINDVMKRHTTLETYVQGDPRGCALYIYKKDHEKLKAIDIDACYSSISYALCTP